MCFFFQFWGSADDAPYWNSKTNSAQKLKRHWRRRQTGAGGVTPHSTIEIRYTPLRISQLLSAGKESRETPGNVAMATAATQSHQGCKWPRILSAQNFQFPVVLFAFLFPVFLSFYSTDAVILFYSEFIYADICAILYRLQLLCM